MGHFRSRSEAGQSLPAALITLAVASLLLVPFLTFVSSRSLGTRAAEETFNEQYAADAGIEFGIWSLLNNSTFRNQVDNNVGTPQSLTFPSPINGYTPVLTVKGVQIGNWYLRKFATKNINQGGSLAFAGPDKVYALRGANTNKFYYYSILANEWKNRRKTPGKVNAGGDLAYSEGYIYALQGGDTTGFWRYNISNNKWEILEETPKNVNAGGALVYGGGDIYALQGGGTKGFWRYDISKNEWKKGKKTPENVNAGGALAYGGGDIYALQGGDTTGFWRYNISNNKWEILEETLENVNAGGALAYSGGDIYALQGNTNGFWRYSDTMGWTKLSAAPEAVGDGGSLVFTHSLGGFAFRGDNKMDFWEFDIIPRYDISSQAGSVSTDARIKIDDLTNPILFWDID